MICEEWGIHGESFNRSIKYIVEYKLLNQSECK